jgi:AcrR family transcriptional regulator
MEELIFSAAKQGAATTSKGERTRALILDTALRQFRERGYEETTMRGIAAEAGVSLGNAYYYFRSKEHLIQAFYAHTHQEHLDACRAVLATEISLKARLHGVMRAKIETILPYHRFSGILFKTAADPASPLNPYSEASRPVREQSLALFTEVLHGSDQKVEPTLREELPWLLWSYHMGVILYWIYDSSPQCRRTLRLVDRTVDIVCRLVSLAALPPLRPLVRITLDLLRELRDDRTDDDASDAGPRADLASG